MVSNQTDLALQAEYSAYVKASVRARQRPLNPDAWLAGRPQAEPAATAESELGDLVRFPEAAVQTGGNGGGVEPPGPPTKRGGGDEDPEHANRVFARFAEALWISGWTKPLSVLERATHFIRLEGDPKRPNHLRPSAPCTVCGDLLCAWAP